MNLPQFATRRAVTVLMMFLALLLMGVVSMTMLSVDLMPEIEPPSISVLTAWPGAATDDVETKVTKIIENDLSIVNNLDELRSTSKEGLSMVTCKFNWGTNLDEAANDIRDRLDFANRLLPDDIEEPMIFKFNTSMFPILVYGVTAEESWEKLYDIIDDEVADELKRLPGVGAVQIMGGLKRQIDVRLDRTKLEGYGLTLEDIETALREENLTLPAGNLKIGRIEYTIRVPGEYETPEEIKNIVVKRDGPALVYMRDVAEVEDYFKEQRRITEVDGKPGMVLLVQKRSGANTVDVSKAVQKKMEELKERLPRDVSTNLLMDSSEFIEQSISNLTTTVLWAGLFVALTTFVFLRNIRTSIIIVLTIPFSLIVAFVFMFILGFTINVMSLMSLAIAIGMVVDNAVVVLENVIRHTEKGEKVKEASVFGASEVGNAIAASTLTTVVIFVPIMFLTGITGIMFKQIGAMISATVLVSLFCALTLTPMLCSRLVKPVAQMIPKSRLGREFYNVSEGGFKWLESRYGRLLGWALRHRLAVIVIALTAFAGGVMLLPLIGTEFVPDMDTGDMNINFEMPVGTKVEVTADVARRIAVVVRDECKKGGTDAMRHVYIRCGESQESVTVAFGYKEGSHIGLVGAKLVRKAKRDRSTKEIVRAVVERIEQADWSADITKLSVDTGNPMERVVLGGARPISIEILGHDLEETSHIAEQIKKIAKETPGAKDPTISLDVGKPELTVRVNRQKAASMGLNITDVAEALRTYFYGKEATKFREADREYDIFMRLKQSQRRSVEDIRNSVIPIPDHGSVILDNIADVEETRGPVSIDRKNQERMVRVEADAEGRTLGEVIADIEKRIKAEVKIPPSVSIEQAGSVKEQRESFRDLAIVLVLGVILVYMVMASQFESLRNPFIVMFSVPFAFVGVAALLAATQTSLSIMSFVGLIMLMGIVVNNAIVLIDYINILRQRGLSLMDAVRTGGSDRLRPVLITTFTTILGMTPMALSRGEGAEIWRPLGITVIGGLSVSTLVTLLLVPVIYSLFEQHKARKEEKRKAAVPALEIVRGEREVRLPAGADEPEKARNSEDTES